MASTGESPLYRDIFEVAPDPIVVHDADTGAVVNSNPAAAELLGFDRAELVGTHVGAFSPPGYTTEDANELIRAAVSSGSKTVEWAIRDADGDKRWVEVTLKRAEIDDRTRVVAFFHEITDRKDREQARLERNEQLTTLIDNLPVVVFTIDPDGVFTHSAGKGLESLGLEPGELEGVPVFEAYADYPHIVDAAETALNGDEVRVTQEVGELVFETWYRPLFDDGELSQVVGVSRDITDLKRREERVEALSDATNELLYSRSEEAVAETVTGIAQRILDRPLAAMWSYDGSEDTLYPIGAAGPATDADGPAGLSPIGPGTDEHRIFHSGDPTVVEDYQELANPSATETQLRTLLCLPLDEHGMLCIGSTAIAPFDSDERFLLEILASTAAAALDRVERETKLKAKQAELERSNEALQQFAYIASHDLQEPLRMVSSYVDLLDSEYGDELDEEAAEYMAYAVDGANRMQEMVDALLRYSRVETQAREFEPTDPGAVVSETLDALRMRLDEVGATVSAGSFPAVRADPNQLGQVLQNLLENAIQYADEAGVEPRIDIDATEADGMVEFRVSDNGPGIPDGKAEDIFEIFKRGGAHDADGTGIGLAVCQRIVQRHDGRIWAESDETGATFRFTLPAAPEGETDE
ncbi:PAS domain-containing sensor histidine kinase [Haloarcula laminariae]|uniref:PAS domain-containing sensor histidine kinase n=1 Tax=Haloarcula laminariae TaxID=2961577 RepID=UPI0021C738CA|nr:PAS domain S-box protein [Halomicroarcula laminariae]